MSFAEASPMLRINRPWLLGLLFMLIISGGTANVGNLTFPDSRHGYLIFQGGIKDFLSEFREKLIRKDRIRNFWKNIHPAQDPSTGREPAPPPGRLVDITGDVLILWDNLKSQITSGLRNALVTKFLGHFLSY